MDNNIVADKITLQCKYYKRYKIAEHVYCNMYKNGYYEILGRKNIVLQFLGG